MPSLIIRFPRLAFLQLIVGILFTLSAAYGCALSNPEVLKNITSNIKPDENVVFFSTAAWLNEEAQQWHVPLHAWVYEPQESRIRKSIFAQLLSTKYALVAADSNEQKNFNRRVNLLISDNERGKRLIVRIDDQIITMPKTLENGHTKMEVLIPKGKFNPAGSIEYELVVAAQEKRRFIGRAWLIEPQGISVISDIDDTVKISNVTDRRNLLENTFFKKFVAVEGMPELYEKWRKSSLKNKSNIAFHYVSSSPWYLYQPLVDFFGEANFPYSSLSLKAFRFRDKTFFNLFKKGAVTKPAAIIPILEKYPQRQFIFVGDSGEQDPEVYASIYRQYPDRVIKIFIRNAGQALPAGSYMKSRKEPDSDLPSMKSKEALLKETLLDERLEKVFKNIPKEKWQRFNHPSELPQLWRDNEEVNKILKEAI